jgi:tRNA G18 (ribose-2'-O)-methylase SpoU
MTAPSATRQTKRGMLRATRGFCDIGIYGSKSPDNLGTLWRSAYQLGASGVFTIGRRYTRQPSDTIRVERHVPLRHYDDYGAFAQALPLNAALVAVEMGGRSLWSFRHPQQAVYLLGAEDHGLPDELLARCTHRISLDSDRMASFNVAVAGSIVLYHRLMQFAVIDSPSTGRAHGG